MKLMGLNPAAHWTSWFLTSFIYVVIVMAIYATLCGVDASGTVTAVGAGSADITATTVNGLTAVCKVTVKAVEPPVEG
jgi:hypothetical protein